MSTSLLLSRKLDAFFLYLYFFSKSQLLSYLSRFSATLFLCLSFSPPRSVLWTLINPLSLCLYSQWSLRVLHWPDRFQYACISSRSLSFCFPFISLWWVCITVPHTHAKALFNSLKFYRMHVHDDSWWAFFHVRIYDTHSQYVNFALIFPFSFFFYVSSSLYFNRERNNYNMLSECDILMYMNPKRKTTSTGKNARDNARW